MTLTLYNLSSGSIFDSANYLASTLSVQDVFGLMGTYKGADTVGVFQGACTSKETQNCTTSCLDASVMFGGLETYHNCLVYPAVANISASGNLSDPHLADSLGIGSESQVARVAQTIAATIYHCLSDYCSGNTLCTIDLQAYNATSFLIDNSTNFLTPNAYRPFGLPYPPILDFDICQHVAPFSFLNADIGGVGVRSTLPDYDIQILICPGSSRFTSHIGFSPVLPSLEHT